tara:strand:- start:1055 stop:1477 length:423 start_codon:yes stop_codon:yes gene_type:complete
MNSEIITSQDWNGAYGILLSQIGETDCGTLHDGVAAPTHSPLFNTFWAPKELNIGNKMCFVTLENPSVMGWNPQVRTFVYELVTNEERKFAAQLLMDREVKRAVRKFGRKKVKASFSDNYVQLNLDLYNMPLDFGGAIEA